VTGRRHTWALPITLGGVWTAAVIVLVGAGWPRYWTYVAAEDTPMTWLQSVVLVLTAAGWAVAAYVHRLRDGRYAVPWLLLAVGFLGLGLDERFALHERIRDRILAPADIRIPFLPWVGPGDFVLLAVGAAGLALAPRVWRGLSRDRRARMLFVVGVGLAVLAVGMDSLDPARMGLDVERLEQTLEECVELASGLAFLGAAVAWLSTGLRALASPAPQEGLRAAALEPAQSAEATSLSA